MAEGDYQDPTQYQSPAPPGYHYDQSGNLVPDSTGQLQPGQPGYDPYSDPSVAAPPGVTPPAGMHWDPTMANWVADATAPTTTDTGGGYLGGTGGGGGSVGSFITPFTGSAPALPSGSGSYIPPTPEFRAPGYTPPPRFDYASFKAPTAETVMNEPGFKFGLDTGLQGLQQSAAARGVLNGGGTLKDVAAWAQNYGGQKYGDAYSREASTYGLNRANAADIYNRNYQTQYIDPYQFQFQGAQAEFAPKMQGYATQAAANQRANEFNYGAAYDQYKDQYQQYLDSQNLLYNYRRPFLEG